MTMTLDLTPETEAYLQDKAARNGQATEAAARALIANVMQQEAQSSARGRGVRLADCGIDPAQAAELRARLATFAEERERPEMDVYDDYDAAKAKFSTSLTV